MNISPSHAPRPDFLFAGFNQDCGCFAVGVRGARGVRVYNTDPLRLKDDMDRDEVEDPGSADAAVSVVVAELLFRCNYAALVTLGERRRLRVWDDVKKKSVVDLAFEADIVAVRLRRDRIVVVMQDEIKVFTFTSTPSLLHTFRSACNPRGLCSLSPSSSNSLLAFPAVAAVAASGNSSSSGKQGRVQLVDLADADKDPRFIDAHEAKLSCLTMNVQGTRLATSSDKGTLIRLYNTDSGLLLMELRRGSQPATIHCINFSANSGLLCASSSHGTIHVFALDADSIRKHKADTAGPSASSSFLSTATHRLMPKCFSSQQWSFARIEVPGGAPCICAFGADDGAVVAVCSDGSYHKFVLDAAVSGGYNKDVYQMIFEVN